MSLPLCLASVLRPQRVTLKDIALEAGLSIASVSMALRNNSNISSGTIQRVRQVARRLGYVPDPALSALAEYRKSRRGTSAQAALALVSNWSTPDGWTSKAASRNIHRGASDRAAELGYSLQHIWAPQVDFSPRRLDQILQTRGIRGVLLAPPAPLGDPVTLDWSHYSVVAIGNVAAAGRFDYADPNYLEAIRACWTPLVQRGYRRIGLVLEESADISCPDSIETAFEQVQRRSTKPRDRIPAISLPSAAPEARLMAWLKKFNPEAIISGHSGMLQKLQSLGVAVPHSIAYASLAADEEVAGVAGIVQQSWALGAVAVEHLHRKIIANTCGTRDFTLAFQVAGRWQEGWTLGSAARSQRPALRVLCA